MLKNTIDLELKRENAFLPSSKLQVHELLDPQVMQSTYILDHAKPAVSANIR